MAFITGRPIKITMYLIAFENKHWYQYLLSPDLLKEIYLETSPLKNTDESTDCFISDNQKVCLRCPNYNQAVQGRYIPFLENGSLDFGKNRINATESSWRNCWSLVTFQNWISIFWPMNTFLFLLKCGTPQTCWGEYFFSCLAVLCFIENEAIPYEISHHLLVGSLCSLFLPQKEVSCSFSCQEHCFWFCHCSPLLSLAPSFRYHLSSIFNFYSSAYE